MTTLPTPEDAPKAYTSYDRTLARDYIRSMTTRPYTQTHPYRPDDIYDLGQEILRDLLCRDEDETEPLDTAYYLTEYADQPTIHSRVDLIAGHLTHAYTVLIADPYSRDLISTLCLENSVCPIHHCDYASCFDDDDPECALIRQYFPGHDT